MKRATMRSIIFAGLASLSATLTGDLWATPHQAHYHYMVGTRANYGKMQARVLHYEASADGFLAELGLVNARTMVLVAEEIGDWVESTRSNQAPEEREEIGQQLDEMESLADEAGAIAVRLVKTIETAGADLSDETRLQVAAKSGELFFVFGRILKQHKKAEQILGIPVPTDPSL